MIKNIYILALLLLFSCTDTIMTKKELELINNADATTPFRVLTIENQDDSLFLRKKALDFDSERIKNDKDLQLLIERLKVTMDVESGIGIAAPQVGISRNLFLFTRIDKEGMPVQVAINPHITKHPTETVCFEGDGCLSIPNIKGNSKRYPWIEVEYYDEKGNLIKEKLTGYSRQDNFTGTIFQHEYDHLQGVLFIDKLCDSEN